MEQDRLFFDGPHDALQHLVRALGGAKKVGHALRPGKSPEDAARWLANALDSDRREALQLEDFIQLLRLGREAGCHIVIQELCRHLGYSEPQPVEPEDQRAALEREFVSSVKRLEQLARSIDQVRSMPHKIHG